MHLVIMTKGLWQGIYVDGMLICETPIAEGQFTYERVEVAPSEHYPDLRGTRLPREFLTQDNAAR